MINLYDVINNPNPKLMKLRSFSTNTYDFTDMKSVVGFLNMKLKMDKLSSEIIYAFGFTYSMCPKGIIFVSSGTCSEAPVDFKKLATGLLLIGAEQFMCFHNHPGYATEPSYNDCELTNKYEELGELIGIRFINHIMITKGHYEICEGIKEKRNYVFGTKVE